MSLEKVIFGFFVLLAATLNFGFFIGDLPDPTLHKTVSRVSLNFGDDPCGCYAAAPTVSAAAAVSGWACRYSAATRLGICL
jgi:hypothetical protein